MQEEQKAETKNNMQRQEQTCHVLSKLVDACAGL